MNASAFWNRVDRSAGPNACWPWTGAIQSNGYGHFELGHRFIRTHRFAYIIANGDIPAGMLVLHNCDNRLCCNPAHLRLGTHRDNNLDTVSRGCWRPRLLTPDQIRTIRQRAASGVTTRELAAAYGLTYCSMRDIIAGRTYRHVPEANA